MIVTTWNIVPDYDEWGVDTSWDCQNWMQWHKELKKKFGSDRAKYIWEYAYEQGSSFSKHWDCRTINREFRDYVRAENLDPYKSTPLEFVLRPIGFGTDVVGGVTDVIGTLGSNTKLIFTLGLIGATAFFGYKAFKSLNNQ